MKESPSPGIMQKLSRFARTILKTYRLSIHSILSLDQLRGKLHFHEVSTSTSGIRLCPAVCFEVVPILEKLKGC